jgi:hypothetical protein
MVWDSIPSMIFQHDKALQQYYERIQVQAEVLDNILVDIAFAPIVTEVATAPH